MNSDPRRRFETAIPCRWASHRYLKMTADLEKSSNRTPSARVAGFFAVETLSPGVVDP
jgi:hypothetical protein